MWRLCDKPEPERCSKKPKKKKKHGRDMKQTLLNG